MKIAIVKLSALGDIVHAMAVLQLIKKYNKTIKIDWVVDNGFKELLEFHPDINKVLVVNIKELKNKKSFYGVINELNRLRQLEPYDMVIDMQGLIKSAIIARLIPSRLTIGFDKNSARESIASIFYSNRFKFAYEENVIERNLELTKYALNLTASIKDLQQKLPFLHSNQEYLSMNISSIKKNIILILGASLPSKLYPVEKFAELANLLDGNYLIVWGSHQEKILADKVQKLAPHVNICEKLSIVTLISLIKKVDLVIGSDTGPTHMAWALNIPSITLFGPTPGKRNSYLTKINRIIESSSNVNPLKINKNDLSIQEISASEILLVMKELLNIK